MPADPRDEAEALFEALGDINGLFIFPDESVAAIRRALAAVRAEEREAIAAMIEDSRAGYLSRLADVHSLAARIRARAQKKGDDDGFRLLVCGGREFADGGVLGDVLERIHSGPSGPISVLIHGAARGADSMAGEWAKTRGVPVLAFPADWRGDGRAAGPLRNQRMLTEGRPSMVVAFPGGRGTLDMIQRANRAGVVILPVPPGGLPPHIRAKASSTTEGT